MILVNLGLIKWLTVIAPVAFVIAAETFRTLFLRRYPPVAQSLAAVSVTILGAAVFSTIVFSLVDRIYQAFIKQEKENEESGRRQAEGLYQIAQELAAVLRLDSNMLRVLTLTKEVLRSDLAAWCELDAETRELYWKHIVGSSPKIRNDKLVRTQLGQGLSGRIWSTGRPLLTFNFPYDLTDSPDSYPIMVQQELRAALAVPVMIRGQVEAVLMVGQRVPRHFSEEDEFTLSAIAQQTGVALENQRLYLQVQDTAALRERARLAAEIHDGLAQLTSFLSMKTKDLPDLIRSGDREEALTVVEEVIRVVDDAHRDVRQAIFDLRQSAQLEGNLVTLIGDQVHEFTRRHRIEAELVLPKGQEFMVTDEVRLQIIRIVQEALSNVAKHSRASRAWVRLEPVSGAGLKVVIADNGRGFETDCSGAGPKGHYGLAIMRERARSLGGSLEVFSEPSRGTKIEVVVPKALRGWEDAQDTSG